MAVLFIASNISHTASALYGKYDEQFYNDNTITNYEPNTCGASNTETGNGLTIPDYTNPVINKNAPDPGVIMGDDGTLHMYVSGLHHYSSKDGVKWEDEGRIKIAGKSLDGASGLWAPDIARVGNIYVLSWSQPQQGIHYATSSSAGGNFEYGGRYSLPSLNESEGIDPQLFSDSGNYYLYYTVSTDIMVATVGVNGKKLTTGQPKSVMKRDFNKEPWTIEAPWVVNKGGTYYLFYSTGKWDGGSGFSRDNYDLRVAKASSPTKKFTRKGSPILTKTNKFTGPGTAATVTDSSGNDWLYYHARVNGGGDRAVMLDPIRYEGGWPVINGGNGPSAGNKGQGASTAAASTINASVTADDVTSGSFRMGTYNAAGVTMQKGGLGGLGKAQANFNAGFAAADQNNATILALQEVAKNVNPPSGWSMYRAPFGHRSVGVAWKTGIWTKVVEKGLFAVDNSKESPNTPNSYKYPYVTLADKNGTVVTVISAHLVSSIRNPVQRPEQARAVRDKAVQLASGGRSVVLGGDWNYRKPALFNDMKPLVPANPNYGSIDHVFGTPGSKFSKWNQVKNTRGFTDHPLVFVDVNVTGKSFTALPSAASCVCTAGDSSSSSSSLRGKEPLEKVFNYFIDKGFSPTQAAGIVGNISHESGGDPENTQSGYTPDRTKDPSKVSGGGGWGLIQWTPASKVIQAKKDAGADGPIYELATQLEILWGHLNNKPPITKGSFSIDEFKGINDLKKATDYFEDKIEGAGKPAMQSRYVSAKLALDKYSGNSSVSSVASVSSSGCDNGEDGAESGNIVQTALNYAWPNRKVSPATKKKPAYATAIKKAKAAGKYTGDSCFGDGVDCGAFVTRVMQDSGVDPNYGGGGNTEAQMNYMASHPELYKEIKPSSTADLKPGDIAVQNNSKRHHTYMYVGKQDGFDSTVASASQCEHAPWAGSEKPADRVFRWFRFIGNGEEAVEV